MKFLLCTALTLLCISPLWAEEAEVLKFVQTISLPDVEGRIDHMAIDIKNERLFVAALGNNTVEVVNLKTGRQIQSLKGFHEPQGVLFIAENNQLIVTNGGNGNIDVFDGNTLKPLRQIFLGDDADNIHYNGRTIYVGYGNGGIALIDTTKNDRTGDIKLPGHPEGFQVEKEGNKIFVNIPSTNEIIVADKELKHLVDRWSLDSNRANFPMALDETHHRLFVATRSPAKLIVFDTTTGKNVAGLDIAGDPDDVFFDIEHKYLYISCGAGVLEVIVQNDPDNYQKLEGISTKKGARTALFVSELKRLFLAVPRRSDAPAEIRIYEVLS